LKGQDLKKALLNSDEKINLECKIRENGKLYSVQICEITKEEYEKE